MDRELRSAPRPILNGDRSAMQFHNALHNGKAQSCTPLLATITPPETAADKFLFRIRYARAPIQYSYRAVSLDNELDDRPWRGVFDCILCEIADRTFHHFGIAFDPYRPADAKQRDLSTLLECQGGNELNHLGTNALRIS